MIKHKIKLSSEFKVQTTLAIISIVFFAITYFLILCLAVGLTVLCIYGSIMLIALLPMFVTIALGIGLASLGVLVLFFLVKFIFKSNKLDRSHLHEIIRSDEPKLFQMIDEIVIEVNTSFPKKVYLSTDVNAAVFYDSNFWSMFFPIKKNLQIGLGLVNTVTQSELKAIMAHEFGHFSQNTMKVGSYVYNVNQVIFNMLYDNESYDELIHRWASVSGYFSIFVAAAVKIIAGIKWMLWKLYEVVNKNYMGLSREMEFHADEIAASVTGFEPLKSSLLRMAFTDHSFNQVLTFYEQKIVENFKSENIYSEHSFVTKFLAEYNNIAIVNNFPKVTVEELNRFNKSKLIIKNQWASHPSTDERIERLEKSNLVSQQTVHFPANEIFSNIEQTQRELTNRIFKEVKYEGEITAIPHGEFQTQFTKTFSDNTFSKVYNGYYDNKNPIQFELNTSYPIDESIGVEELFSDKKVDLVYTAIALQNDVETLKHIANKAIPIKTFDYDGRKYKRKECKELLSNLGSELEQLNNQIQENDIQVFLYFNNREWTQHGTNQLREIYREFLEYDKQFDARYETFTKLSDELQFVNRIMPYEEIRANFKLIEPLEWKLKSETMELLENTLYNDEVTKEIRDNLNLYLSETREYFGGTSYNDENLNILFTAINNYAFLLSKGYFLQKKRLLSFQEELIKTTP